MWTIFAYGLLALPLSILGITYFVFLPSWYVSDFDASIGQIGIALMLARFWDALTDPLIGIISDKLKQKNFSRLKFSCVGMVLLIPSVYFLFNPVTRGSLNINTFFILSSLLFYFALTCVSIPYEAFGIEYTSNSNLRAKMLACRDGFFLFGTIIASAAPFVILKLPENYATNRNQNLTIIYLSLLILSGLIFTFTFRATGGEVKITKEIEDTSQIKNAILNKNFLILLFSFVVSSLGAALPASLFMFFVKHYLKLSESDATTSLLIYFIVGFLSVPVWLRLAGKLNKKNLWFFSQIINAGAFLPVFFLNVDTSNMFNYFISISAMGLGGTIILPSIIQADYIHSLGSSSTQNPVQGLVVGVWAVAKKFAQGIGTGMGFYILSLYNFSQDGASNSPNSILVLGLLYAVVPSLLCFLSIAVAANYKYSEVNDELKK